MDDLNSFGEYNAIASRIIKKGIEDVDISMLAEDKRASFLGAVAVLLYKDGNYEEAVKVITISGNAKLLTQWMNDFISERKSKYAALCAIALKDAAKIEKLGMMCMEDGYYETALRAFSAIGREDLVDFVKVNFA